MSALLSYRNFIDASASVLTLPFSTADAAHPIANLKKRGLGEFLQLDTDGADMAVDVDFGALTTLNFIAAMGLGMATPSGVGVVILSYATSVDGVSYSGSTNVNVDDDAAIFLPGEIQVVIPEGITTRYLRVELSWAKSEPPRFARLWVDNALILDAKVEADADFGFADAGQLDKTDGQQYVEFQRPRTKRSTFTFRCLSALEAWGFAETDDDALDVTSFNGLQFAAGMTGEAIIIPKITDTPSRNLWIRRTSVYGHVDQPFSIRQDGNSEQWAATVSMTEER